MDMKNYQIRASLTDQNPKTSVAGEETDSARKHEIIPLLGLVGEVGGLLSEYKKMLRDGAVHQEFTKLVSEELGDILWYVATVATNFGLDLEEIATNNLAKTEDRWHEPNVARKPYDESMDTSQRFPRKFKVQFSHEEVEGVQKLILREYPSGDQIGDPLTDNTYEDDGYRYHDVLHLTFVACFGWSPIFRKLLRKSKPQKLKNRPPPLDENEDGGRAQVIEEGIIAAAYIYADQHAFLDGKSAIDWQLLRHMKQMTGNLEVKDRSVWEWNNALIKGFKVWRKLRDNKGGIVECDLDAATISYSPLPSA